MLRHDVTALLLGLLALWGGAPVAMAAPPAPALDCHVGLYALARDGTTLDIAPTDGPALRWRRPDGRSGLFTPGGDGASTLGWTGRADGVHIRVGDCASHRIDVDGVRADRVPLVTTDTHFTTDDGVVLAGRLVMPPGTDRVPMVVLLHGSEHDAALPFNSLQRRFPAEGIGTFVYDKRGTGASGGHYTQDFDRLARDAVAASREALRLAGARAGRIGYQGPSQGGWIAPLAAMQAPVDYVLVTFGLAVSVLEEDRSAIALDMAVKGHGPEAMGGALALADACAVFAMNPTDAAFDRFDAVRARYRREPWFGDVHGDFCFFLLALEKQQLPALADMKDWHTPWAFDPLATIQQLPMPQLWILAQDDRDAPSTETARRLRLLRESGRPITTAVFPRTEHGILEYETAPDGTRHDTRHPEGYVRLMADFIRGAPLQARYGTAWLER